MLTKLLIIVVFRFAYEVIDNSCLSIRQVHSDLKRGVLPPLTKKGILPPLFKFSNLKTTYHIMIKFSLRIKLRENLYFVDYLIYVPVVLGVNENYLQRFAKLLWKIHPIFRNLCYKNKLKEKHKSASAILRSSKRIQRNYGNSLQLKSKISIFSFMLLLLLMMMMMMMMMMKSVLAE